MKSRRRGQQKRGRDAAASDTSSLLVWATAGLKPQGTDPAHPSRGRGSGTGNNGPLLTHEKWAANF